MATDDDVADDCISGDSYKDERGFTLGLVQFPTIIHYFLLFVQRGVLHFFLKKMNKTKKNIFLGRNAIKIVE